MSLRRGIAWPRPDEPHAWLAPGRVNLMGDHTDYNGGHALPMAIDLACRVEVTPIADAQVVVRSDPPHDLHPAPAASTGDTAPPPGSVAHIALDDGLVEPRAVEPGWARYVAGVAAALGELGIELRGADLRVTSTLPIGAGLSSSAALEVACALALCAVAGARPSRRELALACQRAEHLAVGVPCGAMDQVACLGGVAGHALLLDCATLTVRPTAIHGSLAVLVVDSGERRHLADGWYATRREACERAARDRGLAHLVDATPADVDGDPIARHVVTEHRRVEAAARALADGDARQVAALLAASHASLRDDFGVSTPGVDALVDSTLAAGAIGARLTGAGFGGCVVAIAPAHDADAVIDRIHAAGTPGVRAFACAASDGARRADARWEPLASPPAQT